MKKNIVIVILLLVIALMSYQPAFTIFDMLAIRRHDLGVDDINIVQRYYYDLNHDFNVDEKDLNIMREMILNE